MEANSPKWVTVSDSPHDHEREALAFLRRVSPWLRLIAAMYVANNGDIEGEAPWVS